MKQYIKNNLAPILIGIVIGESYFIMVSTIADLICKITLIVSK